MGQNLRCRQKILNPDKCPMHRTKPPRTKALGKYCKLRRASMNVYVHVYVHMYVHVYVLTHACLFCTSTASRCLPMLSITITVSKLSKNWNTCVTLKLVARDKLVASGIRKSSSFLRLMKPCNQSTPTILLARHEDGHVFPFRPANSYASSTPS